MPIPTEPSLCDLAGRLPNRLASHKPLTPHQIGDLLVAQCLPGTPARSGHGINNSLPPHC
jgi:hypothetical protein